MSLSGIKKVVETNLTHLLNRNKFGVSPRVDNFILKHGDEKIDSLRVVRTPINKSTVGVVGVLSPNFKNKNHFRQLYHLGIIVNGRYTLEKNEGISVTMSGHILKNAETLNIPINKHITIYELLDKTRRRMGREKFIGYNVRSNNCQDWINAILHANHLMASGSHEFIKQETDELINENLRKTSNTITDTARLIKPIREDLNDLISINPIDTTQFKLQGQNPIGS